MKALLINPWVYDFKCHDFWIRPYGLLKISAMLKKNGFKVDLIDCMDRFDPEAPAEFKKKGLYDDGEFQSVELAKPDVYLKVPRKYKRYGISVELFLKKLDRIERPNVIIVTSAMTYMYEGVILAIRYLKEKFPFVPVILGGIYATLSREHATAKSGASFVWAGSINNEWIRALNKMTGSSVKELDENGMLKFYPDYSHYKELPHAAIKFTEGCPFSCSYCAIKQFAEKFSCRTPENIFEELEILNSSGVKTLAFYDDALLYKKDFVKNVLKEIIKRGYKFNFMTPNGLHAAYIDDETAELMFASGFHNIRVSLETSDAAVQKLTGGKVDSISFKSAVKSLKKAGYSGRDIGTYILAGLPGTNTAAVKRDIEFVKEHGVQVKIANYSPIPGTREFMKLKGDFQSLLRAEPLKQNEFYFLCINSDYTYDENEKIKRQLAEYNNSL